MSRTFAVPSAKVRAWAGPGLTFRLAGAAAIGFAAWMATGWSVPYLPFALEPLGNTAAPWVIVALALAACAVVGLGTYAAFQLV